MTVDSDFEVEGFSDAGQDVEADMDALVALDISGTAEGGDAVYDSSIFAGGNATSDAGAPHSHYDGARAASGATNGEVGISHVADVDDSTSTSNTGSAEFNAQTGREISYR